MLKKLVVYHARDVHKWDDGQCDFQPQKVCSCSNYKKTSVNCVGKPYENKHILTCPFHSLAYEVECYKYAAQSQSLLHPV